MIRINRHPSPRMLRQFGLIWLLFAGLLSGLLWHRTGSAPLGLAVGAGAAAAASLGFVYLPFMRLLYLGLSGLTWPIGWLVSHLLLGGIYYLVLTPIGLLLRMSGRDPMDRRPDPSASSYWAAHPRTERPRRYFKQF